jgi:hypothetical protein
MGIEDSDTLELQDRYSYLIKDYANSAKKLAEVLESFGRKRKELQLISAELLKRGVKQEENKEIESEIKEKLAQVKNNE